MTTLAAHTAAQAAWHRDIDALAWLLDGAISFTAFGDEVDRRYTFWMLPRAKRTPVALRKGADLIVEKIHILRNADVHDSVIGLVLRRRLSQVLAAASTRTTSNSSNSSQGDQTEAHKRKAQELRSLLQGLAYVNEIPAKTWFKEGLGIDV